MVSDFFLPNLGGIEMHIYQLSQCLLTRGHKVIVVTHSYGNKKGVRYMTNGLKVYYIPNTPFYNGSSLPTVFGTLPLLRNIFIREQIEIVHSHQEFSALAIEACIHAGMMGYATCFTNHSLFGFDDASAIHVNQFLKYTLKNVNHIICVSHTQKENLHLRGDLDVDRMSVIPNAVDSSVFTPEPSCRDESKINIVMISRLVYRKGVDLLMGVLPIICAKYPRAHFILGGDGNKRVDLEEVIEKHQLHDQVELLGSIEHADVKKVLRRGHIFLNCSLTEAFCMAIIEAASCGLLVVSTNVGGIPEVFPPGMVLLADPDSDDLAAALEKAISMLPSINPFELHRAMMSMYNWNDVAVRTEEVYRSLANVKHPTLQERLLTCFNDNGVMAGGFFAAVTAAEFTWLQLVQRLFPAEDIELAIDFPLHLATSEQQERDSQMRVGVDG